MSTPFPGMDPYLEAPEGWLDVHNSLIAALRTDLAPRLRPRYFVATEMRIYDPDALVDPFRGRPDLAAYERSEGLLHEVAPIYEVASFPRTVLLPMRDLVRESYLEIRPAGRSKNAVAVIELLSPGNKHSGSGREAYLRKRGAILSSSTHLVEIDLLRGGPPMPLSDAVISDYRILVSRAEQRPRAELYDFSLRHPIPAFPLPLLPGDEEPTVDLNRILHDLYDQVGYDLAVDYTGPADPPLSGEDAHWADQLLRAASLRP
ncbi:MAG: DUF4058 family protein [Caldilineales bacterium]|nr:DUF4058 family protein [Caldilineales bacterium]MCW5858256.1 DUF4058 family protein [Caldilineales bacterium]